VNGICGAKNGDLATTVAVGQRIAEMQAYALHIKFPAVPPKTIRWPDATT